jgi:hydrogenase maturation protease
LSQTVVIGVGNPMRGDDAAGRQVARLLAESPPAGVAIHESTGTPDSLMDLWKDAESVVLVDASQSGNPPGGIERFDVSTEPLPTSFLHCSTHAFGVAEAVELARSLGSLPPRVIVFGIEGISFEHGAELSDEIEEAVHRAADLVKAEFKQ